tara:strand:+ start:83 stop:1315 length:1233 start_codon:yes stop_codon:yes gene_type:complete
MLNELLLPVKEAQRRIVDTLQTIPAEQISIANALGRTLQTDIKSRRTQPPNNVSSMDGYAVRSKDIIETPIELRVIATAPAGKAFSGRVRKHEAVRIFTGAPVPDGADTIVIQENTKLKGNIVQIVKGTAPPGRFIRNKGLDFQEGDTLLQAGQTITARDVGLLAAMNIPWLKVTRKPRIAVLATGDEITMPGNPISEGKIVSSNSLALSAFVKAQGGQAIDIGIAPDESEKLKLIAQRAKGCDMLVTTGGASVGDYDLVTKALTESGLDLDFWRIAMRPGKPLMFGKVNDTYLLGLPGNPVSSIVCAIVFLGPALKKMLGVTELFPRLMPVLLGSPLSQNDEREDYIRAQLCYDSKGKLTAVPFEKQDSSMFATVAKADCLIVRPPLAPVAHPGDKVSILLLTGSVYSI